MAVASFCFVFLFIWCECVDTCITRQRFKFHRSNPLSFALQMQTQIHFVRAHHVSLIRRGKKRKQPKAEAPQRTPRYCKWDGDENSKFTANRERTTFTLWWQNACVHMFAIYFDCAPLNVQFVVISSWVFFSFPFVHFCASFSAVTSFVCFRIFAF